MIPLLSSFYFGSVEHYRLVAQHPKVVIDIGEHYERQSYRTRTGIAGPNGKQDLSAQVVHDHGRKMPMRDVRLGYAETWPAQHLHAIRSAYGNTPWFIHYIDDIEAVLLKKYDRLVELDLATMRLCLKWLGLGTEVVVSVEYVVPGALSDVLCGSPPCQVGRIGHRTSDNKQFDLRTSFHPKKPLPSTLSPSPPYTQIFADRHGFLPRMSVIDLVMNTGPESSRIVRS